MATIRLSAAEWARVESLYPRAAELAGPERAQFLERECGGEPRVRAELAAMLDAAGAGGGLLEAPVGLAAGGAEKMAELLPAGTRLGPWKVRSLIGHGGMGEVYLADRADGAYVMSAAIKLLKRELFSYANAQRFLRERRVLARLSHPDIARVLDAGTTDDGRPYLVMEYVHGSRITEYARSRGLAARDVARLMLAVAEAVAEAHHQGVVHRDLKPANVMVTDDERIKLLDFGIAKLMEEPDAATPGAVPLTPAYAAPEQILGQALSPATDVYALGAMLFQLLTQRLPHRREGLPLPVIASGLRDETVERPSRVVLGDPALLGQAARRRQAQALAGDLDWIVLQALQPDPGRRYASAAGLADDLRRYLEHFPVRARRDSLAYRASRFARRYPTQVAAAGVAVAALALGLAAALGQARVARLEAQRAERVKEFVLSLFPERDPAGPAPARALTLAEIEPARADHARSEARFAEAVAALPPGAAEARAELLKDRGQWLLAHERFAEAERDLAEAARLFRRAGGEHGGLGWFAAAEWGRALLGLGRADEAEAAQREAVARLAEAMGPEAYPNVVVVEALADTLERRGRLAETVALRRRALALSENRHAPGHRLTVARQVLLARGLMAGGGADAEAAALLDQALVTLNSLPSEGSLLTQAKALRGRLPANR